MKRYLLIAAVLFAAVFTIWLMVDHWQTLQRETVETEEADEDRFVMGLSASGEAASGDFSSSDAVETVSSDIDEATQEKEAEALVTSGEALAVSDLENRAKEYAENIVKGFTSKVMEDATDELTAQTDEQTIELSYESVTSDLGTYLGVESVSSIAKNGYDEVTATLRYEGNEGATIRFIFDAKSKLAGIWFDNTRLATAPDKGSRYEETEIKIGRPPYVLDGLLTLPVSDDKDKKDKPPLVILISDLDDADMDGTIGGASNKPLMDMAHGLALHGIASIRYNRRHYQYPETAYSETGIREALLKDAWATIDSANYMGKIDTDSVFVLAWGRSAEYLSSIMDKRIQRLCGAIIIGAKPMKHEEMPYSDETLKTSSDAKYFMDKESTFPLMFLQGDRDFETPVSYFDKWQSMFTGRAHTAYHLYKTLGHYMFPGGLEPGLADYDVKSNVNSGVIADIADWCADVAMRD